MVSNAELSIASTHSKVVIVIPTYNEAGNLTQLFERVSDLTIPDLTLVIVDDNSSDGTVQVCKDLRYSFRGFVDILCREKKEGIGPAYLVGFHKALSLGADVIVQMDADLSHVPEYIPLFLEDLHYADVVIGSRYMKAAGIGKSWNVKRRWFSHLANMGIRAVIGLSVRDVTSGFKAYTRESLEKLMHHDFQCAGFAFQTEIAYGCEYLNLIIKEHQIVFVDRVAGKSKMSLSIILEALLRLFTLRCKKY